MSIYIQRPIAVIAATLLCIGAQRHSFAGSAKWSNNPVNGDWNTAANWVPNTVPNGAGEVARFGRSDVTKLSTDTVVIELSNLVFQEGAAAFTVTTEHLFITGSGIVNNSGVVQTFVNGTPNGQVFFTNASAGNLTSFSGDGAQFAFMGSASAASASFVVNSTGIYQAHLTFSDTSTAAEATITVTNGGLASFGDSATAGNAIYRYNPRISLFWNE